jgi:peptidyl-prolyl cis-trans isomerase C
VRSRRPVVAWRMIRFPDRRSSFLALIAVLALLLPSAAAQAADPVLIELGGTRERASFVIDRFEIAVRGVAASQGLPYTQEVFEQLYPFLPNFLEQRATELVLLDYARTRGLALDEGRVDEIVAGVRARANGDDAVFQDLLTAAGFRDEEQLRELIAESELVQLAFDTIRDGVEIGEDELRVAYRGARERFVVPAEACVRHILVEDLETAEAIAESLREGADFAEIAQEESIDPGSAARGGDLGCLPRGATVAPFDEAAFSAEIGALVGPVETQFGYHLLVVDRREEPRQRTFDEVSAQLERELRAERAELALDRYTEVANVRIYPERIPELEPDRD